MDRSLKTNIHCIDNKIIRIENDTNLSLFHSLKICINKNKIKNNCMYPLMDNNCIILSNTISLKTILKSYQIICDYKNENINDKNENRKLYLIHLIFQKNHKNIKNKN